MKRITTGCCDKSFYLEDEDYQWYLLAGKADGFTCPNCGEGRYFSEGSIKKVRATIEEMHRKIGADKQEIDRLKSSVRRGNNHAASLYDQIEEERNRSRGLRSYITRLKKRIGLRMGGEA